VTGLAPELLSSLGAAVVVTAAALALRTLVLRRLTRAAGESGIGRAVAISWDGRLASLLWCVAIGLWGGLEAASLPPKLSTRLEILVQALVIGTATVTAAAFLSSALARFGRRQGLAIALTGLSQSVARVFVIVVEPVRRFSSPGGSARPRGRPDPAGERHGGGRRGTALLLHGPQSPADS
jgi:hypothetical protein